MMASVMAINHEFMMASVTAVNHDGCDCGHQSWWP